MNVLILTPQIPYPPHQGASLRNFNIIQGLKAAGYSVSLLSFAEPGQTDVSLTPLTTLLDRFETVPVPTRSNITRLRQLLTSPLPDMGHRLYAPQFFTLLNTLLEELKPTVVQIEGIELARAIEAIQEQQPNAKIIFDNHNAETALQQRIFETDIRIPTKIPKALYSRIQVAKLDRFERWACQNADIVTAVSHRDAEILQAYRRPGQSKVTQIPNCIDITEFENSVEQGEIVYDLVFTGKMDYRPNVDGMLWFAQEIWPLVKHQKAEAKLAIVGKNPSPEITQLGELPGITVTGSVSEIEPWLNCSRVMIMPLRMGSGTRLKLIQALAAGLPTVSTANGAEGYPITNGEELLIGDTPDIFANHILNLLHDPELQSRLGQNGRKFAKAYDWRVVIPQLVTLYQD